MAFIRVTDAGTLPPGQGMVVTANGREIALFNLDGEFYAIDNECRHASGPLGEGDVDGGIVTCPIHAWEYEIRSGACLTVPEEKVPRYAVKVEAGGVWVDPESGD